MRPDVSYTEEDIKTLSWIEHIRIRPGMYIGKLGDGSQGDDGIYLLAKEVMDNAVDEFTMGYGKKIEITLDDDQVEVRDFGRGIPLGKLMDCASIINTGAKYDSKAFKKSVGLNGVGIKAVNALSEFFEVQAWREGETKAIEFSRGKVKLEMKRPQKDAAPNGTRVTFRPDRTIFPEKLKFREEHLERMFRVYSYLNTGLAVNFNGKTFRSKHGLQDLLNEDLPEEEKLYPIIHLTGEDIEVAFTHRDGYGEDILSFVNGQNTTQGGTHLQAFREALVKTLREHFKKDWDTKDILQGIVAAVAVKIEEPVFESQTKTKLGSVNMAPGGESIRLFVANFMQRELDIFLHKNKEIAAAMQLKISQSERERKELAGIQKLARESARKAKIHNKKLRDCRVHWGSKHKEAESSTLFITEGDSASGSITKSRNVETQAVFSLRGKPLNCFGLNKKVVYENEEFNLLQHALNIEDHLDDLQYNRIVLATDADVDGMHIRLLLITFFLQFFPELIRHGHLHILQTPLFRVRNKKVTRYCYSEEEKRAALNELGRTAEITRFKGLGEISPDEFKAFIGPEMRLDPVHLDPHSPIRDLLTFYMGKNTPDRQTFIINNLRFEPEVLADDSAGAETKEADAA
ncbi:MAG: DNA topoisomerase IV subunit B [Verrucomicrobiales bacterium]